MSPPTSVTGPSSGAIDRTLLRQVRRYLGIEDESELLDTLREAEELSRSSGHSAQLSKLLGGLGVLLERISVTYEQHDRDLALRSRSLEISSVELTSANSQLQAALTSREQAIARLRMTAHSLREEAGFPGGNDHSENLEDLIEIIGALVQYRQESTKAIRDAQLALQNQKFALDQHAIVSITDRTGSITYANDKFCEISGYSRSELEGANHRIVNSGRHPPEFFREMWDTICAGRVWSGEIQNRAKNGRLYWVSATIVPFLDDSGVPYQYVAIRTDITARHDASERLQEQLHFNQELVEAIPLPVYVKDLDMRYRVLNRAFEQFFGVKREEYIGRTAFDLLTADGAKVHEDRDRELLSVVSRQDYEAQIPNRNGSVREGIYHKATLTRPDGGIAGLVGTISDITERKALEDATLAAKVAAEAANRAKSDFLANMSHEIRTPLNGIMGMLDLMIDGELNSEQREFAEIARGSATGLLSIINEILDFSKIEAGKLGLEVVTFDLHALVANVVKLMQPGAIEKGLTLACNVSNTVPRGISGDPLRLKQVVLNLVSNAVKFTERGQVELTAELEQSAEGLPLLHLAVVDTGIGIPSDRQKQIFDAFSQEDASTTRRYGGTGLGLTICSRLVDLMGGTITLESELGRGSTFHVRLPVPEAAESPTQGPQSDPRAATLNTVNAMNILIAEDNPVNRKVIGALLEKLGHRPNFAVNGQEAVDMWRTGHYDLILMDMQMPILDGAAATKEIRAEEARRSTASTPIYALTAAAMAYEQQRGLEAGLDGYLTKPIDRKVLQAVLNQFAGRNTPAASLPAFDYTAALARADAEIVGIIGQEFIDLAPADLEQMHAACAASDYDSLGRLAHTYKGLAANFGARPLQDTAGKLQQACKDRADVAAPFKAVELELLALCAALKAHLANMENA